MFQNDVQISAFLPSQLNHSNYGFKFFKIVKTVVDDYNFRLKVKTMVGDYSYNFFFKMIKVIVIYHDFNFILKP